MGKSLPSTVWFQEFSRLTSDKLKNPKHAKPISKKTNFPLETTKSGESKQLKFEMENSERQNRVPLKEVVSDCVKRWFQDALKEAKAGDIGMQVLVGQMYYSGYGVGRDAQKGRAWISRASKSRSSVWKVSDKRPGYNASDSDSEEELKGPSDTK